MKKLLLILSLISSLWFSNNSIAQEFHEVRWSVDGVQYRGFLIYYDDDDAFMRVAFEWNGTYNVAEFDCYGEHFEEGGYSGYLLDGEDAEVLYGSEDMSYYADNFIFLNENGEYSNPYHIDDNGTEQEDTENYLSLVDYWEEIDPSTFTPAYLQNFFGTGEEIFQDLLAFSQGVQETQEYTPPVVVEESPAKMHLILVANTMIPDIGSSCKIDKNRVESEIEVICEELKMELNKVVIDGSNLKKESLNQALNRLSPGSNDVVLFVFSGHGYRWSNQESQYPRISLRYSNYQEVSEKTSYNLGDIYEKIVSKGARLNIVLGDCCNSDIGVTNRGGEASLSSRNNTQGKILRLQKLFLESKGNLIAAAAQPYETACGNTRDGGYFIHSFFQSLAKETSYLNQAAPNWNTLIDRTISAARYKTQNLNGCDIQNGIYKMTPRR